MQVHAHLLPDLTSSRQLAGQTVVVIDVLRASTTIVQALSAGAREVHPCLRISDALALATQLGAAALLGGERNGVRIDGFALGNSPAEYTVESVNGRTIIMTTTNGTKALAACSHAANVLVGAFTNLGATCRTMARERSVHLLCAGTGSEVTGEDVLLAGAIIDRLGTADPGVQLVNDQAQLCRDAWQARVARGNDLVSDLARTQGGRNLCAIGMQSDLRWAANVDRNDLAPRLDRAAWAIRVP